MTEPDKTALPAGTWPSPVSAESLASAGIRLAQPTIKGRLTYWVEGRPTEKGRSVLVECNEAGEQRDLTPPPYDVRSRVHEYGGSAYLVDQGNVFFVNASDQNIYRIKSDQIVCVCQDEHTRFANMILDEPRNRLIAVAERHADEGEPENYLASICLATGSILALHAEADFYSSPTLNSDGSRLAFLSWNHPNMPWDETTLHLAELDYAHRLSNVQTVSRGYAAFSPLFGPDDRLYFVSDEDDWWNLYVHAGGQPARQLTHIAGELGMPHWIFGMSTYGFASADTIVAAYSQNGSWQLCTIDLHSGTHRDVNPWTLTAIEHLSVNADGAVCHAASPDHIDSIIRIDPGDEPRLHVLKSASDLALDPHTISIAQPIRFGDEGKTAYGFYYAPLSSDTTLDGDELPPLIVLVHGGPTTATGNGFSPRIQFWTSRGFAVLDVNYRGSTGFGRRYRHSLRGQWGVSDVEDCISGAQYLIDQGSVHSEHIYIMGGSAGGYTVLSALAFKDFFAGGISLYGVGDLALLVRDTHKFEARYLDTLVAPFDESLYRERSPFHAADQIRVPVLFFQGTEDKMVPPNQAETMVDALKNNGVPVGYEVMVGEGHGFRRDDSIITLMNVSLAFFQRIMGHEVGPDRLHLYNDDELGAI